ncbi:MAG: 50S ribosomal protein L1 [Phycisphaerales bacterium]|nr:MAG: 50S ribosomal protein L1 [Phycisphaerales bacterium]
MPTKSVRYRKQLEARGPDSEPRSIDDGIDAVKRMAEIKSDRAYKNGRKRKDPDQTVEICLHLGIDARQADQMVRGSLSLPKGTGATKKVIAFVEGDLADRARAAGAVEAGADELIKKIQDGWMDFDVAVGHPSMMSKVGKLGRVLGPQGKMPSPKAGTVTPDVETAVREYAAGKLEFRADKGGNVHLPVGKVSFAPEDLKANIEAVIAHIQRVKPAAAKGQYLRRVCIKAARTPSVMLAVG